MRERRIASAGQPLRAKWNATSSQNLGTARKELTVNRSGPVGVATHSSFNHSYVETFQPHQMHISFAASRPAIDPPKGIDCAYERPACTEPGHRVRSGRIKHIIATRERRSDHALGYRECGPRKTVHDSFLSSVIPGPQITHLLESCITAAKYAVLRCTHADGLAAFRSQARRNHCDPRQSDNLLAFYQSRFRFPPNKAGNHRKATFPKGSP